MNFQISFTVAALSLFSSSMLKAQPNLVEGYYESASPICAYNVAFDGESYYAEGDHSSQMTCADAGVVLIFNPTLNGHYAHSFDTLTYEWTIVSSTAFVEEVKRLRNGEWVSTAMFLFKLQP